MECTTIHYDHSHYFPVHLHPDRYTFSYIIDGSANLICNNSLFILEKGDLVVIPPFVAHQTLIEKSFHYKVIRLPIRHSFANAVNEQTGLTIIKKNIRLTENFNDWFNQIKTGDGNNIDVPDCFNKYLSQNELGLNRIKTTLKKTLIFLESNYNRPIQVDELSDLTNLSGSHFQRLFRNNIGISPHRYLQNLRIEKAKEFIKIRDKFTEIAYDTGFFDQSHFNRYFKVNVGMIPKRYAELVKND